MKKATVIIVVVAMLCSLCAPAFADDVVRYASLGELRICEDKKGVFVEDVDGNRLNEEYFTYIDPCFYNGYTTFLKDGLYGLMDTQGNIVLEARFQKLGEFSEGLIPASADGELFGYCNLEGEFVIEPQWNSSIYPFAEGVAVVRHYENEAVTSIIDTHGNVLFTTNEVMRIKNSVEPGFMFECVTDDATINYLWTPDNEMVDVDALNGNRFPEGMILLDDSVPTNGLIRFVVYENEETYMGYIDRWGRIVVEPIYYDLAHFQDGFGYGSIDNSFSRQYDEFGRGWNLYDNTNKIDPQGNVVSTLPAQEAADLRLDWHSESNSLPMIDVFGMPDGQSVEEWYGTVHSEREEEDVFWSALRRLSQNLGVYEEQRWVMQEDAIIGPEPPHKVRIYNISENRIVYEVVEEEFTNRYGYHAVRQDYVKGNLYAIWNESGDRAFINDQGELACPFKSPYK